MYVPVAYRPKDPSWTVRLLRDNPLALVASNGSQVPSLTHAPVIPVETDGVLRERAWSLVGTELIGHLNRSNPHCRALRDGSTAVAVFHGPHGYVTPALYPPGPAAPTWDFTSVHVHGRIRLVEDVDATLEVIHATVAALEARFGAGWNMRGSLDYFRHIVDGVQAFALRVEKVDSMAKLSQEKPAPVRDRVAEWFDRTDGAGGDLAAMIRTAGAHRDPVAGRCPASAESSNDRGSGSK